MRLTAHIPAEHREDQIEWLVLEDDPSDTAGFYLFYHQTLDEPSEYDSWHETKQLALAEAEKKFGITESCWIDTSS